MSSWTSPRCFVSHCSHLGKVLFRPVTYLNIAYNFLILGRKWFDPGTVEETDPVGLLITQPSKEYNKFIIRVVVTSLFTTVDDILRDLSIISKTASTLGKRPGYRSE